MLTRTAPIAACTAAPSPAGPMIRITGLRKRFPIRRRWSELVRNREPRHTVALDGVTFDACAKEIVGLLGPNGAGKTTLLKILATLIVPDAGHASVAGCDIVRDAARARSVLAPVTADERSLDWRLSARENLRFFCALHGLGGRQREERVTELLSTVGLVEAADRLVGGFSSGMRQRLLIARALLSRPRVLLLDEPTRSLDPLAARAFRDFLREEIAGRQGCTVLLATHDPEEALELCDRIAILDRGRIVALDRPAQLLREFGDERYVVWIRGDAGDVPSIAGTSTSPRPEHDTSECVAIEMVLQPGGPDAVEVLRTLIERGLAVSRFERHHLTVADLLERVLVRSQERARA